jgi:polyphosphate kinase
LRQRIIDECLVPYLHDTRDAWDQQPDGSYRPVCATPAGTPCGGAGVSAQQALMLRYIASE